MRKVRRSLLVLLPAILLAATASAGPIYFESATYIDPPDCCGGVSLTNAQLLGVRFNVLEDVTTESVGGQVGIVNAATAFAAIVRLTGQTDYPDSFDLATPDVLGWTTFTSTFPAQEVDVPLVLALSPGWYGLMFGGGLLGATGQLNGYMPNNGADIGTPSYFLRTTFNTYDEVGLDARFFVRATPNDPELPPVSEVPEPGTWLLLASGLAALAIRKRAA